MREDIKRIYGVEFPGDSDQFYPIGHNKVAYLSKEAPGIENELV
jgi:hypothetical protein